MTTPRNQRPLGTDPARYQRQLNHIVSTLQRMTSELDLAYDLAPDWSHRGNIGEAMTDLENAADALRQLGALVR